MVDQLSDEEILSSLGATEMPDKKWKKVDTSASANSNSWKPAKGESLIGVFTGKTKEVTTKYGPKIIYVIEKEDNTFVDVWETAQLKRGFSQLRDGQEIKITFLGRVLPDKGNAYNSYEIETAE